MTEVNGMIPAPPPPQPERPFFPRTWADTVIEWMIVIYVIAGIALFVFLIIRASIL